MVCEKDRSVQKRQLASQQLLLHWSMDTRRGRPSLEEWKEEVCPGQGWKLELWYWIPIFTGTKRFSMTGFTTLVEVRNPAKNCWRRFKFGFGNAFVFFWNFREQFRKHTGHGSVIKFSYSLILKFSFKFFSKRYPFICCKFPNALGNRGPEEHYQVRPHSRSGRERRLFNVCRVRLGRQRWMQSTNCQKCDQFDVVL